ncbi:MAG: alpha/beta hydrolase [Cycloclasticus sp.]
MTIQYLRSVSSAGIHKLSFSEWGDKANPRVLVCSHGLTRNKHDFDTLATMLAEQYRVICYDFPGRGESGWLSNKDDYNYQQYSIDALMVIAYSGAAQVDWLGTSMGGLQGIILAAMPNSPIKRLILNDVGPFISQDAMSFIASYVGKQEVFDDLQQLEGYLRLTHAGMGQLSDQQWQQITTHSHRILNDGKVGLLYDPGISQAFKTSAAEDVNLWPLWQAIQQPTLLIRGENSALLSEATADKMTVTGPCADLINIPNTGHAPALMNQTDISAIQRWLNN